MLLYRKKKLQPSRSRVAVRAIAVGGRCTRVIGWATTRFDLRVCERPPRFGEPMPINT